MNGTDKNIRSYSRARIIFIIVMLAVSAAFVIYLFVSTNEETKAVFGESSVQFTGMYGRTYAYADIKGVSLEDAIPALGMKTNGSDFGGARKGDWDVSGMGNCRLYVMLNAGPYIVMDTASGYVIINNKDAEKTKELYRSLLEKLAGR